MASAVPRPEPLHPVFLKLGGRKVVLVGGGPVAAGKLGGLLAAGATVTVVAPQVVPEIRKPGVTIVKRRFEPADLDGAWLAVAAAPGSVNREVAAAGAARRVFVNAVDDVGAASAYMGGVLRRGGVTVAVSTEGQAPALAGLLREALESVIPENIAAWATEARSLRSRWRTQGVPIDHRRPLLLQALNRLYAQRRAS